MFKAKDLSINFSYRSSRKRPNSIRTTCTIFDKDKTVLANATSVNGHGDEFNKSVGRRLALVRAMFSANLDRETRTVVWNAYWKACTSDHAGKPKE